MNDGSRTPEWRMECADHDDSARLVVAYAYDLAAVGQPLQPHLSAQLKRVSSAEAAQNGRSPAWRADRVAIGGGLKLMAGVPADPGRAW
jgi:hypothetical protein